MRTAAGPATVGPRPGGRAGLVVLLAVLLSLAGTVAGGTPSARAAADVSTEDARVPSGSGADAVELDTSLYLPASASADDPAPAVLLAHGFGGSKASVAADARDLAGRGYVVLAWSARGFGASTGQIGLDDPRYEVADVSTLLDLLAERDDVLLDGPGDPRVGIAGGSYGGALALLAAGYDQRVDAIAPQITWNSLTTALFPDQAGVVDDASSPAATPRTGAAGVFKRLWSGLFFGVGSVPTGDGLLGGLLGGGGASGDGGGGTAPDLSTVDPAAVTQALTCGRFRADVCAAYQSAASTGRLTPEVAAVLDRSSPATVLDRITAPTLLVQGTQDSLFGLGEADANARGIAANGTEVKVVWYAGGHDSSASDAVTADLREQVAGWFDHHLRGTGPDPGAGFSYPAPTGLGSGVGTVQGGQQTVDAAAYPGLAADDPVRRTEVALQGRTQPVVTPPGGSPAALSTLPGLGGVTAALGGTTLEIPGQYAAFDSAELTDAVDVVGAPTVTLQVAAPAGTATLFAKLYDVGPDGSLTLPSGLVAPLALTGLSADPSAPTEVAVTLPAIVHRFEVGHTMRLLVSSTDQAYALPADAAVDSVGLAAGTSLAVPEVPGQTQATAGSARWWVLLAVLAALALLGWLAARLLARRRGRRLAVTSPDGEDVPLRFTGVTKAYKDGFVAVRDLSFEVRRGQVLGLLGPNGAGKTTSLRMLMGLIRPTEGRIEVFGHAARPGAPVLSRLGSFVEGTGLLPHLSGRDNLDLYWAATGRPRADAHMEEAIEVAGLGTAIDKRVRSYSQGMRQRVAIAQAMLGLPDLLVLDEPTNGLDPPQIHAMRDVLRSYADTGRTVIVSSHLLAEIEQTCSHVVVMAKGRKIAQGTVEEIVGTGGAVLIGLADERDADRAVEVLAGLPGAGPVERTDEGLVVDLGPVGRAQALTALVTVGVAVDQLTPRRRLEDAFLSLVGES
ncbi:ABC-type multidrug transport system, ATPase component [Modestobacter italicus]|uniref:ABC-type multidrug transport system, ATPase component n=1 Tax=Modestobacter italicus (strain DSM 44449 / CECT 9708 / BC 501) TaxID=2732864 RepID=I4ES67_MODI5|nr:alpha/beta fold hydrolase [Modestobacter marinus]CCH86230.1 ABC-type multidrug transport system, ATPase component [Modestobacter marinus]